jgi:hypothetical protein
MGGMDRRNFLIKELNLTLKNCALYQTNPLNEYLPEIFSQQVVNLREICFNKWLLSFRNMLMLFWIFYLKVTIFN